MTAKVCLFSMSQHSAKWTEHAGLYRSKRNSLRLAPPHSGVRRSGNLLLLWDLR